MPYMSSQIKPLIFYGGVLGPNPLKTSFVLNELEIPYETVSVHVSKVKEPEYLKVNPNGRLPALEDPNTGLTIWESGAIIEYLIEKYDPDHKLSFPAGTNEFYLLKQWLHFQMSGQGPYYGQAWWFTYTHPERIQSCIDRYVNEIKRVSKVLDVHLTDRQYLVGEKYTYADLAFLPWQDIAARLAKDKDLYDPATEFPHVQAWLERIRERPAIKKVLEEKDKAVALQKK